MTALGVNVDHVATVRQARRARYPAPVKAAFLAELGGADQITVHLRQDRRHIQDADILLLRQTIRTRLNVELAPTEEMIRIALRTKPDQVTLVPERPEEITTEGGLDVSRVELAPIVQRLHAAGIEVGVFIDSSIEQARLCHRADVDIIEINTGPYAEHSDKARQMDELKQIQTTVTVASKLGLGVAAGHGLDYWNVKPLLSLVNGIEELNIGHAIVARALYVGFERAVRDMKDLLG